MPEYKPVDKLANDICNDFLGLIEKSKTAMCMEKLCTTSSKILQNLDKLRDSLMIAMITTRSGD
jgi:hypothetical protein